MSLAQIIGSHPDSRSFGDGDGYLPAEGVGAVLLKPLARAVQDGDTILAVIKSSAINHSGRTHGYSVPNPNAQAQLMLDNFRKSGIDLRSISYVESAANGSALGDPRHTAAVAPVAAGTVPTVTADARQIVVLSARNWDRLRTMAGRMLAFVQQHPECSLADLAYTLQTGRERMATRPAMVAASRDALVRGLAAFLPLLEEHTHVAAGALATTVPMFTGDLEGDRAEMRTLRSGKAGEAIGMRSS